MDLIRQILAKVSVERIRNHIRALEGTRHPQAAPEALERAGGYIRDTLQVLGYEMAEHRFTVSTVIEKYPFSAIEKYPPLVMTARHV